jgi:hypothetical protein
MVAVSSRSRDGVERRATSRVELKPKDGTVAFTTVNRKFSLELHGWSATDWRPLLLLEESRHKGWLHVDGGEATVKVTAWTGNGAKFTEKIWTIDQDGYAGRRLDRFYRITNNDSPEWGGLDIYYNLATGRKVFTSASDLLQVIVPNTSSDLSRYIAYRHSRCTISSAGKRTESVPIGIIQYGSERTVTERLVVRAEPRTRSGYPWQIQFLYRGKMIDDCPLVLWGVDGEDDTSSLSGF